MTVRILALLLLVATALITARALAGEDARVAYWLHCAGCHGLDGTGAPPEVPTLVGTPGVIVGLPGGREYLIQVPGVAQAAVDDAGLAAVVNYMLSAFSADAEFEAYTADEVARYRRASLLDPLKVRRAIFAGAKAER